jgi:hypothetical protein
MLVESELETLNRRNCLEHPDINGMIILNWILKMRISGC